MRNKMMFLVVAFFLSIGTSFGQEALVILKPGGAATDACSNGAELRLVRVRDYKINGKDEVRLAGTAPSSVTRDEFDKMRKIRLRDLSEIEVRNGLLFVATGDNQKMPAIPDVQPGRGANMSAAQYGAMAFEGQDSGSKQRQVTQLNDISRVFFLSGSITQDEALFRHAREEATVSGWTSYLSKVPTYKVKEAGDGLAQATNGCVDVAMERFRSGNFASIEQAKELAQRVVAMSGEASDAAKRLADIRREEQSVRDRIRDGMDLRKNQRWDDALATWEPLIKYLRELRDLADAYDDARLKSHDAHIQSAKNVLESTGSRGLTLDVSAEVLQQTSESLQRALKEYEVALSRKPDSLDGRQGRREVVIRLGLIDARRQQSARPPELARAREALLKLTQSEGEDDRVSAELRTINRAYATQLYQQALNLVTISSTAPAPATPAGRGAAPPRGGAAPATRGGATSRGAANTAPPATAPSSQPAAPKIRVIQTEVDKKPFLEARDKLTEAIGLYQSDDETQLLDGVNTALVDFHVAQAKRAIPRKLYGTALLYLQAAQKYQPGRNEVQALLDQVTEPARKKVQLHAGVVISTQIGACAQFAQQIAGAVESAIVGGGRTNAQLLERDGASVTLKKMRSAGDVGPDNYAIVSGEIGVCNLQTASPSEPVQSKILQDNPQYKAIEDRISDVQHQIDNCKKQHPQTANVDCGPGYPLRQVESDLKNQLSRTPRTNEIPYSYTRTRMTASGQMQLPLKIDDTVLRKTASAGDATGTVKYDCTAINGVRDNDWQNAKNNVCADFNARSFYVQMAEQVQAQAQTQAAAAIRNVATSYLQLAKNATDQDVGLENYILFALMSSDTSGQDYQQALASIHARDAELSPQTAFR